MISGKKLIDWYYSKKRDLPWRHTRDPYHIWISEVILQQTRIDQGLPYYLRFVEHFPDIESLAKSDEQVVLKIWQGLGYYSRARNLHAAAKQILENHNGIFPESYDEIRRLKGLGDYSAAAVASLAFGHSYPVVDGNVIRLFSRLFAIDEPVDKKPARKKITDLACTMMAGLIPGDFNQAAMEFGALVCKPAMPLCDDCCMKTECRAFQLNIVGLLPFKSARITPRTRFFHYCPVTYSSGSEKRIFLRHRKEADIWKNLYDFPCIETADEKFPENLPELLFKGNENLLQSRPKEIFGPIQHILTHQRLVARFYWFDFSGEINLPYLSIPLDDVNKYPVPRLIDKFLRGQKFI
jgi:A/G-specific adenine glycosylase